VVGARADMMVMSSYLFLIYSNGDTVGSILTVIVIGCRWRQFVYHGSYLFVPDDCSNGGYQTTVRMAIVNNYELKDSLALCSVLHFV
jgi:hypothetical protein